MHIAIIGKKFSGLIAYCEENGIDYTVFKDSLRPTTQPNTIAVDFSDSKNVIKTIAASDKNFDVAVTIYEQYIRLTAHINQHFGWTGLPIDASLACTDKSLMRKLFSQASKRISPAFREVTSWEDAADFAAQHDFPLMLKPANLAKSLLVTKNYSLKELESTYQKTLAVIEKVYKRYAPHERPKLIIEEFMEGSIHSVDAFVDANGEPQVLEQIVDYETGYDIGYDDNFHYSRLLPSRLSSTDQKALRETAAIGIKALGMRNSPAHVEIIMTSKGPRLVEIGARNGGYRERMHALANGINIIEQALRVYTGRPANTQAYKKEPCAVLELFPKEPGIFAGIAHEAELRDLASLRYFAVKQPLGDYVGKASEGFKMCAIVILHHENHERFAKDYAFVRKNITALTA